MVLKPSDLPKHPNTNDALEARITRLEGLLDTLVTMLRSHGVILRDSPFYESMEADLTALRHERQSVIDEGR